MVNTSFEVYKDNFVTLLVAGLIATVLMITIICLPAAVLGMYKLSIRALRGEKIEIGDLFQGFERFGRSWVLLLLYGLAVCVGLLLLVIPGIYIGIVCGLCYQVIADDPAIGAVDALKKSKELVDGNFWMVFGALIVVALISIAASLIPVVGGVLATPFSYAAGAYIYLKLKGPSAVAA